MTEFINLLNIISCNFNNDQNIMIQKDHLKIQLKNLEEIHNNFHENNKECNCFEYLIKRELLSKTIKYLENILFQVMCERDRKIMKDVEEKVNKELARKYKKTKGESSNSNDKSKNT